MVPSILLVEDELPIRTYTRKLLQQEGYVVHEAGDGITALDLLRAYPVDVILCDIALPRLSGYGVLDAVRHNQNTRNVPFVFLTAKGTGAAQRQGIQMGADDYLSKPFSASELLATVAACLLKLDSLDFPLELIPKFMGQPSSQWVFDHLIQPQLGERFPEWYVAYEPESGRAYLGQTQTAALTAAQRAKPGQSFFCRRLVRVSEATTPLDSENAE